MMIRKLTKVEAFNYTPTKFMLQTSHYDINQFDKAVMFIRFLKSRITNSIGAICIDFAPEKT